MRISSSIIILCIIIIVIIITVEYIMVTILLLLLLFGWMGWWVYGCVVFGYGVQRCVVACYVTVWSHVYNKVCMCVCCACTYVMDVCVHVLI